MAIPRSHDDRDQDNFLAHPDHVPDKSARLVYDPALERVIAALNGTADTDSQIHNISIVAGIETSFALPTNTKKFLIRSRECGEIKFSYGATTDTEFLTIPAGSSFEDISFYQSQTIYFQSSKNDIIEIVTCALA